MDRRRFIQHTGALASTWLLPVRATVAGPRVQTALAVPSRFDDVDHSDQTHAVRDGKFRADAEPTESCEVVIIGGGMSGLVSAYRLRNRKLILLEKEPELGGNSRFREIDGCRYSLGAFISQGPVAPFTEFFAEVGAEFIKVASGNHALWSSGRLVRDPLGDGVDLLPWPDDERLSLRIAIERLRPFLDPQRGIFFPREQNTPEMRAYDRRTLWEEFDHQHLTPRVRQLFDVLISARVGDSGDRLSAWYGNYLLSNLLVDSYTMRGGHGDLSRKLADLIRGAQPSALRNGFTVMRVENRGADEVWVTGTDAAGEVHTIAARCAVIAAPKHFAKYVVPDLAAARPGVFDAFSYNAYLVAQVFLKERINAPYETVIPEDGFTRFIISPDALPGNSRNDGGGLITAYIPFPRVEGRVQLLTAEAERLAQQIVSDLVRIRPELASKVEHVILHRWGHPMVTAAPGMSEALEKAREPHGRIVFAHSDNLGITGLYSAVWAGMGAESDVELILS